MSWSDIVAPVPGTTPNPATGATATWRFGPVVDGYTLPHSVKETFALGLQNDVPMLTGGNADEGGATPKPEVTLDEFQNQAKERFGDLADTFLRLYPAKSDAEAGLARNAQARDQSRASTYLWAIQRAQTSKTPVYTYFWNHALPGPDAPTYGAFHTSEVPYALATLYNSDRPFSKVDHRIAALVSSYWVNFATKGDPNGRGLPHWPAANGHSALTMQLGDATRPIPVAGSELKLNFWKLALNNSPTAPTAAAPPARP
jgi:carboxylesterase type B